MCIVSKMGATHHTHLTHNTYTNHIAPTTLQRYNTAIPPPFPIEELLAKLNDLRSAVNMGKDSL